MTDVTRTWPEYPDDDLLERISGWRFGFDRGGPRELFKLVADNWNQTYGSVGPVRDSLKPIINDEIRFFKDSEFIELVTGGWSGNEDLIDALQKEGIYFGMMFVLQLRGGLWVFEVGDFHK